MSKREPEVVVIGGGTLGHATARQVAVTTNKEVCFVKLTDADIPRAASKRNHGWDQSGLFYYEKDEEAAAMMHASSVKMHDACGLRRCEERGIIGVATVEEAERLQRAADALHQELEFLNDEDEARRQLGQFVEKDYIYSYVPDTRLDQRRLMKAMRRDMMLTGKVEFMELPPDKPISIRPERAAYGGFLLQTGEDIIDAPIVLICAGYMIPAMFKPVGIPHDLAVDISPLLRVPGVPMIKVPLFVNMSSSLSLLTQLTGGTINNIIGNGKRRRHDPVSADDLDVTKEEEDSVIELMPPLWRSFVREGNYPVTAGPKIEPVGPGGTRVIRPWVFDASRVSDFKGLHACVPIKATSAWWAMELLLDSAGLLVKPKDLLAGAKVNYSLTSRRSAAAGDVWGTDRMHWEYEKLDDRKK